MLPISHRPIILASTSRYRQELLSRLQIPFETAAPNIDESALSGEAPSALAQRLALAKAQAVAHLHEQAIVIGSDQVADLGGMILGKPGSHERAAAQLALMSGRSVLFYVAVAVVCQATGYEGQEIAVVEVQMRTLTLEEIERYLRIEQPYDCAGSAKSEGLGIALISSIVSDDPTALIGLPLIRTTELLRAAGVQLP